MASIRRHRRPYSATARGALWITLIALAATALALTLQYVQTTRLLATRSQALVTDEAASLAAQYDSRGLEGLTNLLERQERLPRVNEFFYLLVAPDGSPMVGNLSDWPGQVTETGFHSFRTQVENSRGQTRSRQVDTQSITLGGGYHLLVGTFGDDRAALRGLYLRSLLGSLLATGVLGLVLGWWYSRRGLMFVDAVSDAGERFLQGRLDERLPVSRRGDEYDRLSHTINRCFSELEHLVGSLRATTDGMAHDIKTPLTRLRARLELIEMSATSGEALAVRLAECRDDLDHLLRLIDGVLQLARAEATSKSQFVDLDLGAIMRDVADFYVPVAADKGVELRIEIAAAPVTGSPILLGQLVGNLIDNALKYTPPGGVVTATAGIDGQTARLVVSDTGPGVPVERRDYVLRRFARLDEGRVEPGVGIGLSLVDAAVRAHRANLVLDDNHPGLKVQVDFPAGEAGL